MISMIMVSCLSDYRKSLFQKFSTTEDNPSSSANRRMEILPNTRQILRPRNLLAVKDYREMDMMNGKTARTDVGVLANALTVP